MRLAITQDGLQETKAATIEAGKWYFLGASDSPKLVKVVSDNGHMVTYVNFQDWKRTENPEMHQIETWVAQDLIARAHKTVAAFCDRVEEEWGDEEATSWRRQILEEGTLKD